MLAAPLSAATSASVAASAGNDVARAPRAVAAPTRRKVIVSASANGSETISDRVALGRTKLAAALVAIPLIIGAPANADDEFTAAPVEEAAAPVEEAAAPVEEAAAPVEEAAPYVAPVPQGTDDAMSAYEAATRTGGNSSTAKRVVEQSKPKKSGGGGGILGGVGVLALGAAGFAAFKAGANAGGDDEDDEEFYEEPEAEAKPAGNPFASFTEKKTAAAVDVAEEEEVEVEVFYEEEVEA